MLKDEFDSSQKKGTNYESGYYYLVPREPENFAFFENVERDTRVLANTRFGVKGVDSAWQIYTIAYVVLDATCEVVAQKCRENFGNRVALEFYDILNIGTSNRVNMEAEKIGSINCCFQPGVAVEAIAEDPELFWKREKQQARKIFLPNEDNDIANFEWDLATLTTIARNARQVLGSKHKIMILEQYAGCELALTYTFLAVAYQKLITATINRENKEETRVGFRFGSLFRLFGRDQEGIITIEIQPDSSAKRFVKSDITTDSIAVDLRRDEDED